MITTDTLQIVLDRSVYFISDQDLTRVKIGKSRDFQKRFSDLCRTSPCQLFLVAHVEGYTEVEKWFHQRFSKQRLHGEWFVVDDDLATVIQLIQTDGKFASSGICPQALADDLDVRIKIRVAEADKIPRKTINQLLTFDQQQEIRGRFEHGEPIKSIAARFDITKATTIGVVYNIPSGGAVSPSPLKNLAKSRRRFLRRSS